MSQTPGKHGRIPREAKWALIGLAISLPFHLVLILLLAAMRVPVPVAVGEASVLVVNIAPIDQLDASAQPTVIGAPSTPVPQVAAAASELEAVVTLPQVAETSAQPESAGSAAGMQGLGAELGGTGGAVAKADFFGVGGTGKRIAYLVDKSGSMKGEKRMKLAVEELVRSIESLPDFAEVCVVFFDEDKTVWPVHPCFARMSRRNRLGMLDWVGLVSEGGGTDPLQAFLHVMSCEAPPDLVFLLSDGEIPEESMLGIVAESQAFGGTIINTIAFGSEADARRLQLLASQCGGTFRALSPTGGKR